MSYLVLQDVTRESKLRLLMIYAACYPEKFEGDKITKLMEVGHFVTIFYYSMPSIVPMRSIDEPILTLFLGCCQRECPI